ncbi:MAG: insulinase family protein [Chloroflexi bacterium]|nr:MAG: insulinase family protein [Chloroflexota bacterium]
MNYARTVLPNGLRLLVAPMPEARSVTVNVMVGAGSRYERRAEAGISHFLEHIVFKGSAKRPTAPEISQAVEALGGMLNAFTDKEVTGFWARVPARHYLVALDVIADMLRHPMLRESDVVAERQVILEEIRMNLDAPQDLVHVMMDALLFPNSPLGWETAGRAAVVMKIGAEALRSYMDRLYSPQRIVVSLAGPLDVAEAQTAVAAQLGDLPKRPPQRFREAPPAGPLHRRMRAKRGEQAHVVIAYRGISNSHPDRYALDMLNAVLGEGMSSRLFLELREKLSLAYDVHSFVSNYSDAGMVGIYAGVAPHRTAEAYGAALREVDRLIREPVGDAELMRVKDFVKGRLELRMEDTGGVCRWIAGQELLLGHIRSVEEIAVIIDSITADDIQRMAQTYLRPELSYTTVVGPQTALATMTEPVPAAAAIA